MKAVDESATKATAEATFQRQRPLDGGDEAKRAVEAARVAEAEKTAKLRALRLAKEQSDRIAADVRRSRRDLRRP